MIEDVILKMQLSKETGILDLPRAKEYFTEKLKQQDNFYHNKKRINRISKRSTIYFAYKNFFIVKAIFTGKKHERDETFDFKYGYQLSEIYWIESNIKLSDFVFEMRDSKYVDYNMKHKIDKILNKSVMTLINKKDSLLDDIEQIEQFNISETEKESLIKTRIGQGKFRKKLIDYWKGCSVTRHKCTNILIASHIKPWKNSNNEEKLDVYNGLLLTPNLDKLFDKGYISFDNKGCIILSNKFNDFERLNIKTNMKIKIEKRHQKYLKFHRENIFD